LPRNDEQDLRLRWSGRVPLTTRILLVNIVALAMLAGGFFYLDSYRARLLDRRVEQVTEQTRLIAQAAAAAPADARPDLVRRLGALTGLAPAVYGDLPRDRFDSWADARPTYRLRDPEGQPWQRQAARSLDRAVNFVAGAEPLEPFAEPAQDVRACVAGSGRCGERFRPGGPCPPGARPDTGDLSRRAGRSDRRHHGHPPRPAGHRQRP
jgi:two-component system sensor histidine kinase ChvG